MKIAAVFAMILVGVDCIKQGMGISPQTLFSENALFLWYVVGICWFLNSILMLLLYDVERK